MDYGHFEFLDLRRSQITLVLGLESTTGPVFDVLVIDHLEHPSED